MIWLVIALILTASLELIIIRVNNLKRQRALAILPIFFITLISAFILTVQFQVWTLVLVYFSIFRLVNILKLMHASKQKDYLRSSTSRSSIMLVLFQVATYLASYLLNLVTTSYHRKWGILIVAQLLATMAVGLSLRIGLSRSRPKLASKYIEDKDLPSITVAVPARNETFALEQCLRGLVTSDYPKLEILVLDDCSQEKRTPEIIRDFAQDGVRFLAGKAPTDAWAAKNFAYQQLLEEASGQLVIFCGVDAVFSPQTLRKMVQLAVHKHKLMLSFMPVNALPETRFKRLLLQPLRYLWEMGLPRDYSKRPPVLSTVWLVDREFLLSVGGFKAVSRSIVPERYFAAKAARRGSGYSFVALGDKLGLACSKSFTEQLSTAIRTRYPSLKERLENVALLGLIEVSIFTLPIVLLVYEAAYSSYILVALLAVNVLISALIFATITRLAYSKTLALSYVVYPLVFIYDIYISLYSMQQYEFSEVIWKGRNVCVPVMKVIPALNSEQK